VTAVIALPVALAIDLLTVVLLRRGLGMGRDASIGIALAVTVAAWALAARLVERVARRRDRDTQTPRG
jgi:hypothetical protein